MITASNPPLAVGSSINLLSSNNSNNVLNSTTATSHDQLTHYHQEQQQLQPISEKFYDIFFSLLRFVHQTEDKGVSLKYTELDSDVALKVVDTVEVVKNHPNLLNIAHFELLPTDKIASEDQLISHFTEKAKVDSVLISKIRAMFAELLSKQRIIQSCLWTFYNISGIKHPRQADVPFAVLAYLFLIQMPREMKEASHKMSFFEFTKKWNLNSFQKRDLMQFVNILFDEKNIRGPFTEGFCKLFDKPFVEENFTGPLSAQVKYANAFAQKLQVQLQRSGLKPKKAPRQTKPEPFMLTIPEPRSIPFPVAIPKFAKPKPVPASHYEGDSVVEKIEAEKLKVREQRRSTYEKSKIFRVAKLSLKENIQESDSAKSKSNSASTNGPPEVKFVNDGSDERISKKTTSRTSLKNVLKAPEKVPKSTAVVILREETLVKKKLQEEEKKLKDQEIGFKNDALYEDRLNQKRIEEEQEHLLEMERKRLDVLLVREEAILAKQERIKDNQLQAKALREESKELIQELETKKLQELESNKEKVEEAMHIQENIKAAKQKAFEENQKIVYEAMKHQKELEEKAALEAEKELAQKIELIKKIRTLEQMEKQKRQTLQEQGIKLDLTATSNTGLLSEMSILELRERLAHLKTASLNSVENKRVTIVEENERKKDDLERRLKHIQIFREREEQKRQMKGLGQGRNSLVSGASRSTYASGASSFMSDLSDKMIHDPKLQELQARLNKKKQERLQITQEISELVKSGSNKGPQSTKKYDHPSLKWKELYNF